ncbi:hypothetical protein I2I05_18950 [Hymenobacter sp. BT683]|uniref:Uncharacterized protein n=1 Tax=Hymenobacter jeongseonensis TaxID=2791027 RepID=A0ABS0IN82_9BACT|nr:hypothetical protein [Hymenobacter jeongseonensis]MBF9239479.1 hypothetical protein [Hymenobacter jeongseonensis]
MILILLAYSNQTNYQDPNTPQVYGSTYDVDRYEFDEVNETVTHTTGGYDDFQNHNPPENYSVEGEFFSKCDGTTYLSYVHDGAGGFTLVPTADSLSCGFVPAVPPSCNLSVYYELTATATGANLAAQYEDSHGAVRYRLDGGLPQASPKFYGLGPGRHVLTVNDTGVANCARSVAFDVAVPAPPAAPVGPTSAVDFVLQPLWYPVAAPAGADVLLELYAESQHREEDFALVFRARRRASASGRVDFRLDTLLAPLLTAVVPPTSTLATVLCRTPLVNYFVRTATVLAEGVPAAFVTSALRTALRGGLPVEHRHVDYFAYRLEAFGQPPFLSWQPAGKRLTAQQPEWLFWLCPSAAPAVLTVRRSYYRTGFAEAPPEVEDEAVDLSAGRGPLAQLLAIPVRPRADTDSMSVALYSPLGEPLSGVSTYQLVPETARSRYLHFTNSLGGFDTLRTEGRLEGVLEASADRFELPAVPGSSSPAAERQAFDVTGSRKLKLATGWLKAAQLRWLQELVLAREIWEWKGGRLWPLDPTKRVLVPESDEAPLRGMLLEFDYAFAPTAYADLP